MNQKRQTVTAKLNWALMELKKKPKLYDILLFATQSVIKRFKIAKPKSYCYRMLVDVVQAKNTIEQLASTPSIAIIVVDEGGDASALEKTLASINKQIYPYWHLYRVPAEQLYAVVCQCNDDYICAIPVGDCLTADALYQVAIALNSKDLPAYYCDHDILSESGQYILPQFKPDFAPDYFAASNYIGSFVIFERKTLLSLGPLNAETSAIMAYDALLRFSEAKLQIGHISKVLYHARPKTKHAADALGKSLKQHLQRTDKPAIVQPGVKPNLLRVRYDILGAPLVSIIIPFKDQPKLLKACVESILAKTDYPHFELLLVSNQSKKKATRQLLVALQHRDSRVRVLHYDKPFNYSAINNYAASIAKGEHLLLLNNDTEVINPGWLSAMLEHSQRPEIGCVGAKLLYGCNDTVQHGGVIIGREGINIAGHVFRGAERSDAGYGDRLICEQNYMAVTAACLMVKKTLFDAVAGLREKLAVAFNDVDFCLKVAQQGYRNIWTPYAELYHHESISRGNDDSAGKKMRFASEVATMEKFWGHTLDIDPYFNTNLKLLNGQVLLSDHQTVVL